MLWRPAFADSLRRVPKRTGKAPRKDLSKKRFLIEIKETYRIWRELIEIWRKGAFRRELGSFTGDADVDLFWGRLAFVDPQILEGPDGQGRPCR